MRVTENKKMIEKLPSEFSGETAAEISNKLKITELKILIDISKSLAIIADAQKAEQKATRTARRSKND